MEQTGVNANDSPFDAFEEGGNKAGPPPATPASTVSSQTAQTKPNTAVDARTGLASAPSTPQKLATSPSRPSTGRSTKRKSRPRPATHAGSRAGLDTHKELEDIKNQTLRSLPSLRVSPEKVVSVASTKSERRTDFAGYVPPSGAVEVDPEFAKEARRLVEGDQQELLELLANDVFQLACKRMGVDIDELMPRSLQYFRPRPAVTVRRAKMDLFQYDESRIKSIGIVLVELHEAAALIAEKTVKAQAEAEQKWEGFQTQLQKERERLQRIERNRKRIQDVQVKENEKFTKQRKMFEQRQAEFEQRQQEAEKKKAESEQEMRERAKRRAEQLERVRRTKEERERRRVEEIIRKEAEREEKKALERSQRLAANAGKEARRQAQIAKRAKIREQVQAREKEKKIRLLQDMAEKEAKLESIRKKRRDELEAKKDERYLKSKLRAKNAERVRRQKEFKYKQMMDKIAENYNKMEHLREMREAIEEERRRQKALEIIKVDEWKASTRFEKDITPGPGEYYVPGTLHSAGGTWGKHRPKSDLEWQMMRSQAIPGPGQYKLKDETQVTGGTWGTYHAKSDLEWAIYHAQQLPGPADYAPKADTIGHGEKGVAFSTTNTPTEIEAMMRVKAQEPGPSDYGSPNIPLEKMTIKKLEKKVSSAGNKLRLVNKIRLATQSMMANSTSKGLPMSPIATIKRSNTAGADSEAFPRGSIDEQDDVPALSPSSPLKKQVPLEPTPEQDDEPGASEGADKPEAPEEEDGVGEEIQED